MCASAGQNGHRACLGKEGGLRFEVCMARPPGLRACVCSFICCFAHFEIHTCMNVDVCIEVNN